MQIIRIEAKTYIIYHCIKIVIKFLSEEYLRNNFMLNKENSLIELERLAEDTVEDAVIYDKPYIYEMSCFLYSGKYMTITSKMKPKLLKITSDKKTIKVILMYVPINNIRITYKISSSVPVITIIILSFSMLSISFYSFAFLLSLNESMNNVLDASIFFKIKNFRRKSQFTRKLSFSFMLELSFVFFISCSLNNFTNIYLNDLCLFAKYRYLLIYIAPFTVFFVYILSFFPKIGLEKSFAYECGFQPFPKLSYPFDVLLKKKQSIYKYEKFKDLYETNDI